MWAPTHMQPTSCRTHSCLRCGVQKVQDMMLAEVQRWCRGCRGGAGGAGEVQGRCRGCRDSAGYLHHLHLSKHNIRCREVQEVQAHLRFLRRWMLRPRRRPRILRRRRPSWTSDSQETPAKTNRSECWCFPRSRHHEPLPLTSVTIPRWAHTCCSWTEPVHHSFLALSRAFFGTSYLTLPALLIPIGRSVLFLGAAPTEPPKKATQPERSTGRCRSTATGSATSAFVFSQLLGLGSAKIDNPELPSPSSALSVVAVVLVAGLVVFGEACLCV